MHIGARLEGVGQLVPQGCRLADIGTDHALLPVWLLERRQIRAAVASDIADGTCQAAAATVARFFMQGQITVRLGAGLSILQPCEADCIVIAGMGAASIMQILAEEPAIAHSAARLVLQPMRGAARLRRWLQDNGWQLVREELAAENGHLYEIMAAEPGRGRAYTNVEYEVGPLLLAAGHPLLAEQLAQKTAFYRGLLAAMAASNRAGVAAKYAGLQKLLQELEALSNGRMRT